MTRILQKNQIKEAAEILKQGGTVIFPTETVYGLGAVFNHEEALQKVFLAKGRPQDNPLILHIYDKRQVDEIVEEVPTGAYKLMKRFWPGPLTLIMKKKKDVSSTISGGLSTIALRMPSNQIALELLKEVNIPLAAPSANRSGRPSPTSEAHLEEMQGRVDAILLGGDTDIGIESTVLDLTKNPPLLLRPGKVSLEELEEVLGKVEVYQGKGEGEASPGLRYLHYAPTTPVVVLQGTEDKIIEFIKQNEENNVYLVTEEVYDQCGDKSCVLFYPKNDLDHAAREYFRLLRSLDQQRYAIIYVTEISKTGFGRAIMDRIHRSSGYQFRRLE